MLEAALGPEHPEVAAVWHNLGGIRHASGDLATAERFARHGLTIRLAALGDDDLAVAADRAALAPIVDGLGRHDEADTLIRQALAVFVAQLGAEHYEVAVALHNLAAVCFTAATSTAPRRPPCGAWSSAPPPSGPTTPSWHRR